MKLVLGRILAVAGLACRAAALAGGGESPELAQHDMAEDGGFLQQPMATLFDVAPACEAPVESCSERHRQEKDRLMRRIDRDTGTWNANHPRWRLLKAIDGFRSYRRTNKAEVTRWRDMYGNVSKAQKKVCLDGLHWGLKIDFSQLLESTIHYRQKLNNLDHLVDNNGAVCDGIANQAMEYYKIDEAELATFVQDEEAAGRGSERISVVQALKHFVRDWAAEGLRERKAAFPCVLETLSQLHPDRLQANASTAPPKVLLPGAGLGRLGFDVASLGGFDVTINEWSTYMIAAYRYLEAHHAPGAIRLHPFIDSLSHHATNADLTRQVALPAKHAVPAVSSVLLVEGDFATVFADQKGQYDVIVTHFFIDTARNLLNYLDTIHALLRRGGHWVNFGPLLYGTGPWVQLSLDEIVLVSEGMGFEFRDINLLCGDPIFPGVEGGKSKVRGKEAIYMFNNRALTTSNYIAQSWVARKSE